MDDRTNTSHVECGGDTPHSGECAFAAGEPVWAVVESPELAEGDRSIVLRKEGAPDCVVARFEGATGNVYACGEGDASDAQPVLAVRIVGDLNGQTGQVTVLQADGTYRRYSRWDRVDCGSPSCPDAIVRTLPQCGCGGSIGMPKLFASFADMSAYFFFTFYHRA